jgi:hypothetical protein
MFFRGEVTRRASGRNAWVLWTDPNQTGRRAPGDSRNLICDIL